jgi:hypothetical protein
MYGPVVGATLTHLLGDSNATLLFRISWEKARHEGTGAEDRDGAWGRGLGQRAVRENMDRRRGLGERIGI